MYGGVWERLLSPDWEVTEPLRRVDQHVGASVLPREFEVDGPADIASVLTPGIRVRLSRRRTQRTGSVLGGSRW